MKSIISGFKQTAKQNAIAAAKQVVQEPFEVLKQSVDQVAPTGDSIPSEPVTKPVPGHTESVLKNEEEFKERDKKISFRTVQALEREIEDIRKQKLLKELQQRIGNGELVYLTDYPNLLPEERQMLEARILTVQARSNLQAQQVSPQITSRPSRRFGSGKMGGVKQEQRRVESVKPPSG